MAFRQTKNTARRLLRLQPARRDNAALWAMLGHALGRRPIDWVTHEPAPGEGAGSQALAMLMARALAEELGVPYAHTPFGQINHSQGNADEYARRWEEGLGLGRGMPVAATMEGQCLSINAVFRSDSFSTAAGNRLLRRIFPQRHELHIHAPLASATTGTAKHPASPLDVTVHLRRGDVTATRNVHMWVPTEQTATLVRAVTEVLDAAGIAHRITVISQGHESDFPELADLCHAFALDEDPLTSFSRMAQADLLVPANSSFSYLAGLLGRGIVLYDDCGYAAPGDWLHCPGGRVDRHMLTRRLGALLRQS